MDSGLSFALFDRAGKYVENFTHMVTDPQIEHLEGPYQCTFELKGDIYDLTQWFNERMMFQVRVFWVNGEVWRGHIYNMTLEDRGTVAVRDMNEFANAVKCRYSDGTNVTYTDWYIDTDSASTATTTESLDRYGRLEYIAFTSGNSSSEADGRALAELGYRNTDKPTTWAYKDDDKQSLSVVAVGNIVLANRIYMIENSIRFTSTDSEGGDSVSFGDSTTVSAEILRIVEMVESLGGYLYPLSIDNTNEMETAAGVIGEVGAYDRLLELTRLRNNDTDEYYIFRVEPDGGVTYELFNEQVDYTRYPPPRGIENPDGSIPTWDAKPGIIRNIDPYIGPSLPGWWLVDSQLAYAERTVMRDGDNRATFHSRQYDIGDYYRAIDSNRFRLERE